MDDAAEGDRRVGSWPDGSALAALIRSRDWSATPFGPIGTWSTGLRAATAAMLRARRPTSIVWGPSYILLYNDALHPLIGARHPAALGLPLSEAFPGVWERLGPALGDAVRTGGSSGKRLSLRPCRPETDPRTGRESRLILRPTPIRDEAGAVEGLLVPMRATAGREAALLDHIPQLVWRADGAGRWRWANRQWTMATGLADAASRGLGWLDAIHPDDRETTMAAWGQVGANEHLDVEHRIWHAEERAYRWYRTRASKLQDRPGLAAEWLGTCTDIHGLVRSREQQALLIAELQHRMRNLLGIVRGIAVQVEMTSRSLEDFSIRFDDRLAALGRVQDLLSRQASITLGDLVALELSAHAVGGEREGRWRTSGPAVLLPGRTVQMLALALHELTTNAAKYGALATPRGSVEIEWRLVEPPNPGEPERLALTWSEYGVAMARGEAVSHRGFGRELIEVAFPYELDATTHLEFAAGGARCRIELPMRPRR